MNELLLERPNCPPPPQGAVAWSYRQQQVEGAKPLERILLAYDATLAVCVRKDLRRTLEFLSMLRAGLDFSEGGDIARRLMSLYLYCEEQVRRKKFDECERILRELRKAWAQCGGAS